MRVTAQTIKNYEKKGLQPHRVMRRDSLGREHEVVVYDPKELVKFRAKSKQVVVADTSGWLTRNQSILLLGVAKQTLKNYERRGMLHPQRIRQQDARNHEQYVVVYDPKELAKLPIGHREDREGREGRPLALQRPEGELNARCFEMFDQGMDNREVVIALRETSDTIRAMRELWLDDSKGRLVITDEAKQSLEAVLGPFIDIVELVDLVTKKVPKSRRVA